MLQVHITFSFDPDMQCLKVDCDVNLIWQYLQLSAAHGQFITIMASRKFQYCPTLLEVTRYSILKILKHCYNQPRIVSMQTKLTQKVDYFTVFESFPSTSCCSQKVPPNKLAGWMCKVVSRMFTLGGW